MTKSREKGPAKVPTGLSLVPKELLPQVEAARRTQLFSGMDALEVARMLPCLGARMVSFEEGEYVLRVGERDAHVWVVESGEVHVIREDWLGNRNIQGSFGPGESFGEAYAYSPDAKLPVSVVVVRDVRLLRLDVRRMLRTCSSACPFHLRLLSNLVGQMASKNLMLGSKLRYLSQRSTRDKLLAFLSDESARQGSPSFAIPYTRQQLADYLSVNRSALSSEISRLRDEGILQSERNQFTLL